MFTGTSTPRLLSLYGSTTIGEKGLLTEINKRDDVVANTFKSSNHLQPNEINENRLTIHVIR